MLNRVYIFNIILVILLLINLSDGKQKNFIDDSCKKQESCVCVDQSMCKLYNRKLARAEKVSMHKIKCKLNEQNGILCPKFYIVKKNSNVKIPDNNSDSSCRSCVPVSQCSIFSKNLTKKLTRQQMQYKKEHECIKNKKVYVNCPINNVIKNSCNQGRCVSREKCSTLWKIDEQTLKPCDENTVCCIPPKADQNDFAETEKTIKNLKDLLPENCGKDLGETKISSGTPTGLREYPWMAMLMMPKEDGTYESICAGALIHQEYVLTAAHCLPADTAKMIVRLGEYDTSTTIDCIKNDCAEMQTFSVKNAVIHSDYIKEEKLNDIALIRLSSPCNKTEYVEPICLPVHKHYTRDEKELMGQGVFITGWGATETKNISNIKLKAKVNITNKDDCYANYKSALKFKKPPYQVICTKGTADVCKGDSGSPLMYRYDRNENKPSSYVCAGISTSGHSECKGGLHYGISMRTYPFLSWILREIWKQL